MELMEIMTMYNEDRFADGRRSDREAEQGVRFYCDCCECAVCDGDEYWQIGKSGMRICGECYETELSLHFA